MTLFGFVKKSKWALVAYTIAHSWYVRRRFRRGGIDSISGSTHRLRTVEQSVAHINATYEDYLHYGQIQPGDLTGKTILEGGPGDSLGVALRFIADGAERVVAMDRFYARQDPVHQRNIYLALRDRLAGDARRRYDEAVDLRSGIAFNEARVKTLFGRGWEQCGDVFEPASFDVIISRVVVQEISDTDRLFAGLRKVLRPGGIMLHKIDLRDYGTFSSNGHHPLEFLTIPDRLYDWMARASDRPNRKLVDYYRDRLSQEGFESEIYTTMVVRPGYASPAVEVLPHKLHLEPGVDYAQETLQLVREIRPRLVQRMRRLADEDLMVAGIFVVSHLPFIG